MDSDSQKMAWMVFQVLTSGGRVMGSLAPSFCINARACLSSLNDWGVADTLGAGISIAFGPAVPAAFAVVVVVVVPLPLCWGVAPFSSGRDCTSSLVAALASLLASSLPPAEVRRRDESPETGGEGFMVSVTPGVIWVVGLPVSFTTGLTTCILRSSWPVE